jgi:hypothetical protein
LREKFIDPALDLSFSVKSNQMLQHQKNFKLRLDRLKTVQENKLELGNVMVKK